VGMKSYFWMEGKFQDGRQDYIYRLHQGREEEMKRTEPVLYNFVRRFFRRWKWPIAAIISSILMSYALYWTGPEGYRTSTFGILPSVLTFALLFICFSIIIAGILYDLNTKFRIYYICKNCDRNFIFEGHKNPNVQCPFCSSESLRIAEIITIKEHPRGLVWNPPNDLRSKEKVQEFKICPMCGSLEDIASSVCSKCSYKFETGSSK